MGANIPRPSVDENIATALSSGITDVATSMSVADGSKIVSPCYLVIDRVDSAGTFKSTSLWEYVKVTNVSGNDLTTTRGQGGSTAQAHSSGAVVEAVITSSMFEDWYNVLNPEHDSAGGHVITGTMTIAGMNLASVATIAQLSANKLSLASPSTVSTLFITTHIQASGASIVGWETSSGTGGLNAYFHVPGGLASQTNIGGLIPIPTAFTGQFIQAYVQTPASVASINIHVNKNFSVYGVVAIPGGATFASSASIASAALVAGDVLTMDINSLASLSQNLSVLLRAT